MNSNPKRPKVARTTTTSVKPAEDRISSFLDSVLSHILSFLPTKIAATTSVLSTRWKYLFLGVPKIDLHEQLPAESEEIDEPEETQEYRGTNNENRDFINFVNRRLMLCQTLAIAEFRLKCHELPEDHVANLWLTTLLLRKVEVVEIEVQGSESEDSPTLYPPCGFFRSKTLVVLKLCGEKIELKIPEFVSFPNLKVLHLKDLYMQFESNYFGLAAGYPLLEDLRLEEIRFQKYTEKGDAILGISMCTLRKLAILGVTGKLNRIDIDTPDLQHLKCTVRGNATPKVEITLYKCESLVSADLDISPLPLAFFNRYGQWVIDVLTKANLVKELHLSGGGFSQVLDVITKSPPEIPVRSLPQFPNLTHLELDTSKGSVWVLLQSTPNLISLVCNMASLICAKVKYSLCSILNKMVTLRMENLLQKGAAMERMIIERCSQFKGEEWPSSICKQLLKLSRGSAKCEVELV